ncbi:hypothetical protein NDR87_30005 [Nocardia sp. CDC159]|uniref:Uncharacterized protein n=1 Tax=Nocardia pulmonis TaxID=2951408 RepID=A0A9X2EDR5_9NOCA|nr:MULTISPECIES: hypothetical protein [Nocardia]MCM6777585.1 hypothetical protein [Nocardia pulmonis]MCM6790611.1 hypothetical protein [Nocardia sp. CDC159]
MDWVRDFYSVSGGSWAKADAKVTDHLVTLVRNGAVFHKGKLLEQPIDVTSANPDESHATAVA